MESAIGRRRRTNLSRRRCPPPGGSDPASFLKGRRAQDVEEQDPLLNAGGENYEEAIARAVSLGATSANDIYRGDEWKVHRDPEGNEFCIIRPEPEK